MKKIIVIALLLVACGLLMSQSVVDITYVWDEENHVCITSEPLYLATIMDGEWSGPGVVDNVFYPATLPAEESVKLMCDGKDFFIHIHATPYVAIGWIPKEMNLGTQAIQLSGYPFGGEWYCDGDSFDGMFHPIRAGVHEVMYVLTDEYGCTSGVTELIEVK